MDLKVTFVLVIFVAGCCSQLEGEQEKSLLKNLKNALKEAIHTMHGNETISDKIGQHDEASSQKLEKDSGSNKTVPIRKLGPIISVKLIHGEDSAISISETSSRKRLPEILSRDNLNVYSIDNVYRENLLFYTAHDRIFRASLEGRSKISNIKEIVDTEVDGPVRLAVDWVHGKLYWMADRYQTVKMADLDGNNTTLLFDNIRHFSYPNNIAVDPYTGLLFFVSDYSIYKSDLAGENVTIVAIEGNSPGEEGRGIRCVALDRAGGKLYFSGKNHQGSESPFYLARANYDGSDVEDFVPTGLDDVYSMEVLGDTLYFAQHKDHVCHDELMSASTTTLEEFHPRKIFVPSRCKSNMWSIKLLHPCTQKPAGDKYCSSFF